MSSSYAPTEDDPKHDMLMAGPVSNTDFGLGSGTDIDVTNSTHQLAAGLSGLVTVYTTATTIGS